MKSVVRYQIVFILLAILFFVAIVMNVNTGSVNISPSEIVKIILFRANEGSIESKIIWSIRLPRLLGAAVLGGALSVSGFMLQTFFRNPIAGPFVLGISSGAKMFVGFVMLIMLQYVNSISLTMTVVASFAGSMLSMLFVLLFSKKVRNMSMLLVVGIMIGYICSAVTNFFITFAVESDIANLTHWAMGSFSGMNWDNLKVASIVVAISLILAMIYSKPIGAFQLGEGYAQSIGINIKSLRVILIILSSIMSACVTAFAGPISFVGIAVPHITKMMCKTTKPIVIIPASFLCGAVFCMFCDLIARSAFAPVDLAIGTVTAVFGAPVVIWLMLSRQRRV
ncbi:iron ABC transporter permease [Sedimentibacter sp. zth1]|uniref:FecCD family ABC transporter permease n=1 Tax=Sedimentibacter sp. zth1 TaxID=2816908 RepID=UPI001A9301B1|nr:iron ABC transporter permease [Sedimentibacter sp. zth1]QSX05347.1 iron ABC transporter permease [Sedimentibacter sp. zth1]